MESKGVGIFSDLITRPYEISVRPRFTARGLWGVFSQGAGLTSRGVGITPQSIPIRVFDVIPSSFSPKSSAAQN